MVDCFDSVSRNNRAYQIFAIFFLFVFLLFFFSFSSSNELEHSGFLINKILSVADFCWDDFNVWFLQWFWIHCSCLLSTPFFFYLTSFSSVFVYGCVCVLVLCPLILFAFFSYCLNIYSYVRTITSSTGNIINYFNFNLNVHTKKERKKKQIQ